MIEFVHLKNFQGHADIRIDFDPYYNTIVGPNDVGKSTIIRAIRWVVLNRPSGDSILRQGSNEVKVKLGMFDKVIVRKRGKVNCYLLDGVRYEAMGTKVPEAISDLHHLNTINFQIQKDQHFWFSLPPGQIAKELNSIINLESIDKSLSNAASEIRKTKMEVEMTEERYKDFQNKAKSLSWIKKAMEEYEKLEVEERRIDRIEAKIGNLQDIVRTLREHRKAMQVPIPSLDGLQKKKDSVEELQKKIRSLVPIIKGIRSSKEDLDSAGDMYEKAKTIFAKRTKGSACPICGGPL